MSIIKRSPSTTIKDLITAMEALIPLLRDQGEDDAADVLGSAKEQLEVATPGSKKLADVIRDIIDAFEGEHELISYTLQRDGNQWTEAEQLSQASSRVLSLARRLR